MEQMIRIHGRLVSREALVEPEWQEKLRQLGDTHGRAVCMCSPHAPEMYATRRGGRYFLARVPGSGGTHHPACPSFDVDDVDEVTAGDRTILRPAFPLYHDAGSRNVAPALHKSPSSGSALNEAASTLDALLLHLWRKADFNRWLPRMAGKRHWDVIRRHIEEAATAYSLGKEALDEHLFLPTSFSKEKVDEHKTQNTDRLKALCSHSAGRNNLALVFGIAKAYKPSLYGCQIQIRHLPEVVFYINQHLGNLVTRNYPFELLGFGREQAAEVLTLLLVEQSDRGNFNVVDMALMRTTSEFLPVKSSFESELISFLVSKGRSFIRPLLRKDEDAPQPVAFLTDAGPSVVPIYISLAEASPFPINPAAWSWNPSLCAISSVPSLPPVIPREKSN